MFDHTTLWNLPVWGVLFLAVVVGLTVFNTIDSITKIWREPTPPKPPKITPAMNPYRKENL